MGLSSAQAKASDSVLGPRLPLRVGRFTLCEEIGAGGMATVYLARMELAGGLDRLVALKTIHPHLAKEQSFVDMFLDEARIASHVGHPNVCASYDFGETDGVYYLAMEHLLGEPLFDVVNRMVEKFDEVREVLPFLAARILADAAEGVHAAHAARGPGGEPLRIVHRDVSPQNLFVTYDGSVKVVDFGCAKAAERVAHTSTGVLKGKVGYASPEQLRADHVDHRADVWGLGVCLWETLTLSPLFSRDTAVKTAMAVLGDEVPLASEGRPWVPERVAQIAARALGRDRRDRYESARQLSRDLREFIADSGYSLESAELSEWMEFLFGERRAERMAQVQRARELDLARVPRGALHEVEPEDVELLPSEPGALALEPDEVELLSDPDPRVSGAMRKASASPARAPRRWVRGVVMGAVLLGLGLGGAVLYRYYEPADWVLELLGLTPAGAATEPPREPPPATDTEPARATEPAEEAAPVTGAEATTDPSGGAGTADETGTAETGSGAASGAGSESGAGAASGTGSGVEVAAGSGTPAGTGTAVSTGSGTESGTGSRTESGTGSRTGRSGRGPGVTTVVSGGGGGAAEAIELAPTAEAATGLIALSASRGFAEVYLGGRHLGRTPLRTELPVGRHRLRILPYGQEPGEAMEVSVEAGLDQGFVIDVGEPPAP